MAMTALGDLLATVPLASSGEILGMQIPPAEKVLRTVVVYLGILIIVRVAGKRLLAQMNSLDLVVVLLLSNVVQNAIVGDDNSLAGGLLGAAVLILVNAGMDRLAQHWPAFRVVVEGRPTVVVQDGQVRREALERLGMTDSELNWSLRHQGADNIAEVKLASLDPGGSVTVDLRPEEQALSRGEFQAEVARLHARLDRLQAP